MINIIDGQVYETTEVVTETQTAIATTHKCAAYKTTLSYVNGKITANYLDYENNPVDFNGEIVFEFNGEQIAGQAVNGVAEIDFTVIDAGTYVVRTANTNVENSEVTINA